MRKKVLVSLLVSLCATGMAPVFADDDDQDTSPPIAPQRPMQGGTQSTTLQSNTQSTTLQTGTQSTTLQSSTQSTTLQTGTQGTLIQGGAGSSTIQAGIQEEAGPLNILFVLDCSMSMKEKLGGDTQKMDAAKRVLQESMQRIPSDVNVGLRVFGQSADPNFACNSSALLVPLGQGNRGSIVRRVNEIKPYGLTPIAYALQQAAADDFRGVDGRKVIILITDGADTCNGDPCALIASLPRYGIKLKVDVVGVDMRREQIARAQLDCIARTSGGKYYDAGTAAQLIESVSQSVDKAISGRVIIKPGGKGNNVETPVELRPMEPMQHLQAPPTTSTDPAKQLP